ncbi:MAG: phosphoglycerate mutase family protein, partial [Acholeplasmatales bacterium]|nr:phosphoglycerate mutase family protein [Acholeplasmatales bacterium]
MNIYLIRHGQTKSNRSRKVIGRCLDPNLNKQGRLDALRAYENLSNAYPPYDIIYSSTMKR